MQKTPMEMTITGGEETSIEIGITRSAGLTGRVMVYEFAETDGLQHGLVVSEVKTKTSQKQFKKNLVETHGLSNAIMEFSSKLETWRVLTDRKGRFTFNNIRPGTWTLSVYTDTLPQYHRLEKDRFEVELIPGEQLEMLIRVLPQKRTITIIEEGKTVIEE